MARYIKWSEAVARYPSLNSVGGAAEMEEAWIHYVEDQVQGLLASTYSLPLVIGHTVKDLCIELLYIRVGKISVEETADLREAFMERINRIVNGEESMIDNNHEVILPNGIGNAVYSNTADYNPVFNLDDAIDQEVDPNLLEAIADAKL